MVGDRFGRLVIIGLDRQERCGKYVNCRCECGNEKVIFLGSLKRGSTKSCGCLNSELSRKRRKKHGLTKTTTHNIWLSIKARCLNPSNHAYKDYGGRGITICNEWANSFESFLKDMDERPEGKTIDRIDNNYGYCKDNCRWASASEQSNNRRSNVLLTLNGQVKTAKEWSDITGISYFTLLSRIKYLGWTDEKALTKPVKKIRRKNEYSSPLF